MKVNIHVLFSFQGGGGGGWDGQSTTILHTNLLITDNLSQPIRFPPPLPYQPEKLEILQTAPTISKLEDHEKKSKKNRSLLTNKKESKLWL